MASTAFLAARGYLETGAQLCGDHGWEADYTLTMALHFGLAECTFITGLNESAEAQFAAILQRARTDLERARLHGIRSNLAQYDTKYAEALEHVLAGLALLGAPAPGAEEAAALQALAAEEAAALEVLLSDKEIGGLVNLSEMTDETRLVEAELLGELTILGMFFSPLLVQVATLRQVRLSVEHGNSPASPSAYAAHGMTVGAFTSHWCKPVRESIELLRDGVELGQRIGAPLWAAYSSFFVPLHLHFSGLPISETAAEFGRYMLGLNPEAMAGDGPYLQLLQALRGETESVTGFDEEAWGDAQIGLMKGSNWLLALQHYFLARLMANVYFDQPHAALATAELAATEGDIREVLFAQLATAHFTFFHALALVDVLATGDHENADALRETLDANRQALRAWAKSCPESFGPLLRLVEAGHAALVDDQPAALDHLDAAIAGASDQGMLQHLALAHERAFRFHLGHGRVEVATLHLRAARAAYARWGATGKVAAVVDYCRRTREQVLLTEATDDDLFRSDPYIEETHARSVLAMPLVHQGQLMGVLYLENNVLAGAFTEDQVQVLEALCAQIAVSIDNERMYQSFLMRMSHELRTRPTPSSATARCSRRTSPTRAWRTTPRTCFASAPRASTCCR